ncbi:MAG TPA: hypothetical protein PKC28_04385 [Bdellovibrionales bacterium]|nr:hypothetical protein [Bdellovibrionales bacterium]
MLHILMLIAMARAEYRVFELVIMDPTSGQERVEVSNLDPRQYRKYHPLKLEESITYRATWMCKGNTSHRKRYCPNPKTDDQSDTNSGPKT